MNCDFGSTLPAQNYYTWFRSSFFISTDPRRLDLSFIYNLVVRTNSSNSTLSFQDFKRVLEHSLCFGLYILTPTSSPDDGNPESKYTARQIGFARVVTDHIRLAYLCNLSIVEEYKGLHEWMFDCVLSFPEVPKVKWIVRTTDLNHPISFFAPPSPPHTNDDTASRKHRSEGTPDLVCTRKRKQLTSSTALSVDTCL
ncbi:hypothetical protein K493DRAFT_311788 [Basidiobolus meristosporus CBS 931.73]|uniref:Uncharacterized protein n=1 Tax=Basidiobolus meristosporus CBS 931.73 TaxID=1314790 RepID=A0A1Y1YZ23_9FUNG|nr:hypothetical protein K493DRAFT_311788 [Basidiobolus meristosporus CBS 931.73]|eukprot:ORY03282.1 hypothetical protein K493DRAFT_311788 [Basidiobolus meristosporus CBS 931.73]